MSFLQVLYLHRKLIKASILHDVIYFINTMLSIFLDLVSTIVMEARTKQIPEWIIAPKRKREKNTETGAKAGRRTCRLSLTSELLRLPLVLSMLMDS